MEDDSRRFDEDATTVNFAAGLNFAELDAEDVDLEVELLAARVQAARYTGA